MAPARAAATKPESTLMDRAPESVAVLLEFGALAVPLVVAVPVPDAVPEAGTVEVAVAVVVGLTDVLMGKKADQKL